MEGTEGLGDGGAVGLAGAACPQCSPDKAGLLLPFSQGWGGKGLLSCLHAVWDRHAEGKPAGPARQEQLSPSVLPVFAFVNELVYMFLSGCAALEPWAVPQPAPCYPLGTPVGTHVLSLPCHRAHFSARLGTRVLCVGAKRRASDKCQKRREQRSWWLSPQSWARQEAGVNLWLGP